MDEIVAEPWRLDDDGMLAIPDSPGLGIQLDPDAIARYGDAPLLLIDVNLTASMAHSTWSRKSHSSSGGHPVIFNSPERIAALTRSSSTSASPMADRASPTRSWSRCAMSPTTKPGGWLNASMTITSSSKALGQSSPRTSPRRTGGHRAHGAVATRLAGVVEGMGTAEGRSGGQNTWVIDMLLPGDVLVVDLFGKIEDGTFIGDNLGTAIAARAGTGSSSTAAFAIWSASTSSPTSMSSAAAYTRPPSWMSHWPR